MCIRDSLGSLEPRTVTEAFCQALQPHKNLCPHFHLSLQSGCDKTLRAMGRRYDTERFLLSCCLLRQYFPGCAITTDLITGFPGETEEDFAQTLDFLPVSYTHLHIAQLGVEQLERGDIAHHADHLPIIMKSRRCHRHDPFFGQKVVANKIRGLLRAQTVSYITRAGNRPRRQASG